MSERLIGFPTTWTPSSPSPVEITRTWPSTPLQAILAVTGLTIHHLVMSTTVKAVAFQLYKAWREIERDEDAEREEAYRAWLKWVKYLVPVEAWG